MAMVIAMAMAKPIVFQRENCFEKVVIMIPMSPLSPVPPPPPSLISYWKDLLSETSVDHVSLVSDEQHRDDLTTNAKTKSNLRVRMKTEPARLTACRQRLGRNKSTKASQSYLSRSDGVHSDRDMFARFLSLSCRRGVFGEVYVRK